MSEITLRVNGTPTVVPAASTIGDLVRLIMGRTDTKGVAVAVDREVVPRSSWESTTTTAGVSVEIVTAAAGG
jgi:sulfur carrier protein